MKKSIWILIALMAAFAAIILRMPDVKPEQSSQDSVKSTHAEKPQTPTIEKLLAEDIELLDIDYRPTELSTCTLAIKEKASLYIVGATLDETTKIIDIQSDFVTIQFENGEIKLHLNQKIGVKSSIQRLKPVSENLIEDSFFYDIAFQNAEELTGIIGYMPIPVNSSTNLAEYGLLQGDIIIAVEGNPVPSNLNEFLRLFEGTYSKQPHYNDQIINLTVNRANNIFDVEVAID